jgi:nicotinate-nucleotide adenylyltransferase
MNTAARRIGILGGTFDPIHRGHLDAADAAVEQLKLTRLFVVTSNVPPHRAQPLASPYHRFAMVSLAVVDRPDWRAADLELRHDAPSFTSRTLGLFHERGCVSSELFFVIGADAFSEIEAWRDYTDNLDAAHFAVVSRPGPAMRAAWLPRSGVHPPIDEVTRRSVDHFDRGGDHRCVIYCDQTAPGYRPADRRPRTAAGGATS